MSRFPFGRRAQSHAFILPFRRGGSPAIGKLAIPILVFCGAFAASPWLASSFGQSGAVSSAPAIRQPDPSFDGKVRGDMFLGMAGDQAAFERAMKLCEETLAKDPNHAEALSWHGAGLVWESGQAFMAGDFKHGKELTIKGHAEMDKAVFLLPESVTVLIPRGATDLETSKHIQIPEFAKKTLEEGLRDYEKVLKLQQPELNTLPVHSRGELLSGLAEGWNRDGNSEQARQYAQKIVTDLPGSAYATRSQAFLAQPLQSGGQLEWHCLGCHR